MVPKIAFLLTICGHVGIWVAYYNQMNALNLPRRLKKAGEALMIGCCAAIGAVITATVWDLSFAGPLVLEGANASLLGGYAVICWGFFAFVALRWSVWKLTGSDRTRESNCISSEFDMTRELGYVPAEDGTTRWFAGLPGNELFRLSISEKEILLPELPRELEGTTIAHVSDLHMTGHIAREYYEQVIAKICERKPDLFVVTGDIIDKRVCLDWLAPVFAKVNARHGGFYVLGNHDQRIKDEKRLRKQLKQAGLQSVNGKWHPVSIGDSKIWLAGNERPWYPGAEKLAKVPPNYEEGKDFKLLLSHSPDQVTWAKRYRFPLMLAGHTHGGQIRLPFVGPVVSPSRFGVEFASGLFRRGNTWLHVSRGVSGVHPVRWNCTPEVTLLRLRCLATQPISHSQDSASDKLQPDLASGAVAVSSASTARQTGAA